MARSVFNQQQPQLFDKRKCCPYLKPEIDHHRATDNARRPDWAIYCNLGNFLKSMSTIVWPKLLAILKEGKIFNFASENSFSNFKATFFYKHSATFFSDHLVTLSHRYLSHLCYYFYQLLKAYQYFVIFSKKEFVPLSTCLSITQS